jgi:hypothetical protein
MATSKPISAEPESKFLTWGFWQQAVVAAVVAGFLLVITNSAIWINHAIFDTNTFTKTAVTSITSPDSTQALAREVVDRALTGKPTVKAIAGPTATKLVGGLLESDQFSTVLTKAVTSLQVYLTTSDSQQKSISIDLTGVKNVVSTLVAVADNRGITLPNDGATADKVAALPDQLILLDANNVPSLYNYGVVFLWVAPICTLLALALMAYPYFRNRSKYYQIALMQGSVLAVAGLLSLLFGPLFRPPVLAHVTSPNMRIVVGNMYNAFINLFNNQAYTFITIGVLLAVLPLAVHYGLQFYTKKKK